MILAGKKATVDGSVLLAHNNDLYGNEASKIQIIPRKKLTLAKALDVYPNLKLARQTRERVLALTGLPPICPDDRAWFYQMFAARLPELDPKELWKRLREEYNIEALAHSWNEHTLVRASFQGYNNQADADALMEALEVLIPEMSS